VDEVHRETQEILDSLARDACRLCGFPAERHSGRNSIFGPALKGSAPETHLFVPYA
jgi:hypothetical protein